MKTSVVLVAIIWGILAIIPPTMPCSCMLTHPQEAVCMSDFVALARVSRVKKQTSSRFDVSRKIKVKKMFKANEETELAFKKRRLYEPSKRSSCSVRFPPTSPYLIVGRVIDKEPRVNFCSFIQSWKDLSPKMKKGFKHLYKTNCDCKIVSVPKYSLESLPQSPDVCLWETSNYWNNDCQKKHAVCIRKPNGQCSWSGGRSYRSCMKEIGKFEDKKDWRRYRYKVLDNENVNIVDIRNSPHTINQSYKKENNFYQKKYDKFTETLNPTNSMKNETGVIGNEIPLIIKGKMMDKNVQEKNMQNNFNQRKIIHSSNDIKKKNKSYRFDNSIQKNHVHKPQKSLHNIKMSPYTRERLLRLKHKYNNYYRRNTIVLEKPSINDSTYKNKTRSNDVLDLGEISDSKRFHFDEQTNPYKKIGYLKRKEPQNDRISENDHSKDSYSNNKIGYTTESNSYKYNNNYGTQMSKNKAGYVSNWV